MAESDNASAWREFHERYADLIRGFGRRQGLQPADCDDVLQEVLLALSQAMGKFRYDPSKGKFRSYLKTVALHVIYKRRHAARGQVDMEEVDQATRAAASDPSIELQWEEEWRQYHLRQAMRVIEGEFGSQDLQAFQRYAVEGRAVGETAESLDMSVDQVYQSKSRILKRLSEVIEHQVEEEG